MNHTWFSCSVDVGQPIATCCCPLRARQQKAPENGWKSGLTEPCMQQTVNTGGTRITPTRSAARHAGLRPQRGQRRVHGGRCRASPSPTLVWGTFNAPAKSKIAGRWPPRASRSTQPHKTVCLDDIWGWAIPKSIAPERKKVRQADAGAMMSTRGQTKLWKATGAPPPKPPLAEIAAEDPFMALLKESVLDSPTRCAAAITSRNGRGAQGLSTTRSPRPSPASARHRKSARRRRSAGQQGRAIEHDPEKHALGYDPVGGYRCSDRSCSTKGIERMNISQKTITL